MNKKVMKLASRGKRFGAYCLDGIAPFILTLVLTAKTIDLASPFRYDGFGYEYGYGYGYGYGGGASAASAVIGILIVSLLLIAYLVVQIVFYTKSKTIGKAILGLQVISSEDGKPVGVWKMILREWFAKKASAAPFCLGYIWVLIDDRNRGWHDKIMDTYVVDLGETAKLKAGDAASAGHAEKEAVVTDITPVTDEDATEEKLRSFTVEPVAEIEEDKSEPIAIIDDEPESIEQITLPKADMSMKKEELVAVAEELGIKVPSKATKADIIELIENK